MSKMKHLLRKLHIGGGGAFHDHHRMPTAGTGPVNISSPPPTTPQTMPFQSSASSSSSSALTGTGGAESAAAENSVDFNFFEEEFQMQLALAISVSDPEAREDAETAQIKAAKQRSLGCSPSDTFVEFLSLRYWSNNVVNYDDKVMDGFYDVYGIISNSVTQGKMPLLVDLEAISVSDNVDYEVILVNRAVDSGLRLLEEKVSRVSSDTQALEKGQIMNGLIQKIADLIVDRMGGPVGDADEMLKRWTMRSSELRSSLDSIILPIGCLDVGLSRHRALLFKVLADRINLPCMLIKGSYYTGTDEGAVNLIKADDGSEYIIDLMGAPGTLIPAEVPSCNLQNFDLDIRSAMDTSENVKHSMLEKVTGTVAVSNHLDRVVTASSSNSEAASSIGMQLKRDGRNVGEKNQTERFEHDFGKLLPSLRRPHEGLSSTGGKPSAAKKLQVKDVSKYVISAAKNPDFAQKLHAVLSENGALPPSDLISDINPQDIGEEKMLENVNLYNGERMDVGLPHHPVTFGLDYSEVNKMMQTDDAGGPVGSSRMVARNLDANYTHELPLPLVCNPFYGQPKNALSGEVGRCFKDNVANVCSNIGKEKETCMELKETASVSQHISCTTYHERSSQVLGAVAEWEIPWEDLQIGERIGIGSYGEVYRAEWNGTEVAVKKFLDQDISGDALDQFKCEVEMMLRLRHPNVVLFMGAVPHPPNLSILTEFLPRGSLYKLLHRSNIQLDEKRRLRMALDVAKGMNYLHTSNPMIVHRDLKTLNLLVDKNWVVKVCDFGMSRLKHHTFLSSTSTAGTPEWMAPEVLRNELSNEKSDVYSFGVILWELATLRIPWTEMNSMQVVGAVGFQHRHLDIPEWVDPLITELITDCWNPDPQLRPSFGQIISRIRRLCRLVSERKETSKFRDEIGRNETVV